MACSICKGKLRPHCHETHPTCTWLRCPTCRTVLDLVARRGYDSAGRRFRIVDRTS